jgi:selenocysteine lyase/cysteine desulfurase
MRLTRMLVEGLRQTPGVTLYCQDGLEGHIAVVLFNVEGFEAGNTGTILDVDHNIACRTGLHCAPMVHEQLGTDKIQGGVRFGIGPFNTDAHIEAAINGVREIAAARAVVR